MTTDGLTITHTSTVTEDQIDHLGHMNVRYYAVNARAATRAFVGDGRIVEMYTRHHREQLLGSELEVRSGVLGVSTDTGPGTDAHADTDPGTGSTRVYHELANVSTGEIAATFVYRVRTDTPSDLATTVELPGHGRPRSIDLDTEMVTPSLAELRDLGLAMRKPRTLTSDDAAGHDTVPHSLIPFLFWGGEPVDGDDELVHEGTNGEQIGWATMETRAGIERLPGIGTRIQSFCATISVADKTTHQAMWLYDVETSELLAGFDIVSVLFDIGARRAMSIPDDVRADRLSRVRPELAARPAD